MQEEWMRTLRTGILVLVVLLAGAAVGVAQSHDVDITIGAVALLAVDTPGTAVALTTQAPGAAGDPVEGTSDTKAIFYTVLTAANYRITAQLDALPVPAGFGTAIAGDVDIQVNADPAIGPGAGTNGATAGDVTLTTAAQDIITGIGSTVTGTNAGTAPLLTYTLLVNDVSRLAVGDNDQVTVTLTLTTP
jgi:hypothetical protein